jgi:hypothetical protein
MKHTRLLIAITFLLSATLCFAGDKDDLISLKKKQWITVTPVSTVVIGASKSADVKLHFRVNDGFHINSHLPKNEALIPTSLRIVSAESLNVGNVKYPLGTSLSLPFDPDSKLDVYSGDVVLQIPITAKNAKPGDYVVKAEIQYQACNDRSCFPPRTLAVEWIVTVK